MRILDSHVHFWQYEPIRDAWITEEMNVIRRDFEPDDLSPIFSANAVEGCVAVQADRSTKETAYLCVLAEKHSIIKGVVGWVDLFSKDLEIQLAEYSRNKLIRGFREIMQGADDNQYLTNKQFHAGIEHLTKFGYTYDILIYHHQLPAAIRFTEQHAEQKFMLDHLAKPDIKQGEWKKWKLDIREIARNPNIFCKVSGLITEADWQRWNYDDLKPFLEIAAEYFGMERLCFGSDWPVCQLAGKYEQVIEMITRFLAQVSLKEREMVFAENTRRFYTL